MGGLSSIPLLERLFLLSPQTSWHRTVIGLTIPFLLRKRSTIPLFCFLFILIVIFKSWVAICASLSALLFILCKKNKTVGILAISICLCLPFASPKVYKNLFSDSSDRQKQYSLILDTTEDRIWGDGVGSMRNDPITSEGVWFVFADSDFIQLLKETGIIGTATVLVILLIPVFYCKDPIIGGSALALVVTVFQDSPLFRPGTTGLVLVLVCISYMELAGQISRASLLGIQEKNVP